MKKLTQATLSVLTFGFVNLANAQLPIIEDFLRNTDGTIITYGTRLEAEQACLGLPTARELAEEATKYGSDILELNEVPSGGTPGDYYLVSAKNPDGSSDSFYYSSLNYKAPFTDLKYYGVWSSSTFPGYNDLPLLFRNGYLGPDNRIHHLDEIGARCLRR